MATNKDYDLHLGFYHEDEYCGGTWGRVVTSDILRHGQRNLGYYAFKKATEMVQKWLSEPRYFGCEMADLKVKFYLEGERFDLVLNATEWTRMLQVGQVRIPVAWKKFEPVTFEPSEIHDDDIPF